MHSTHKGEQSSVADRFTGNLKYNTWKRMTSISKNVYIDKLDKIVNKYSNIYHNTTKMKSVEVK